MGMVAGAELLAPDPAPHAAAFVGLEGGVAGEEVGQGCAGAAEQIGGVATPP